MAILFVNLRIFGISNLSVSQGLPSKQIVHDFPAQLTPCLKSFHLTPPPLCKSTTNVPCSTWNATIFLLLVC